MRHLHRLWYDWLDLDRSLKFELILLIIRLVVFWGSFLWLMCWIPSIRSVPLGQLTLEQLAPGFLALWFMLVVRQRDSEKVK